MKILALERDKPGATDADFAPHLKAEAARAYELYHRASCASYISIATSRPLSSSLKPKTWMQLAAC
jgi:hypothetical protein